MGWVAEEEMEGVKAEVKEAAERVVAMAAATVEVDWAEVKAVGEKVAVWVVVSAEAMVEVTVEVQGVAMVAVVMVAAREEGMVVETVAAEMVVGAKAGAEITLIIAIRIIQQSNARRCEYIASHIECDRASRQTAAARRCRADRYSAAVGWIAPAQLLARHQEQAFLERAAADVACDGDAHAAFNEDGGGERGGRLL